MTAEILPFARKPAHAGPFQSFDEVSAYMFAENATVDAAEAARLAAWFAWFGVDVDMAGPPQSVLEGWAFLRSEMASAAHYRKEDPRLFKTLHDEWTRTQVDYLDAVIRGDAAEARALLPNTPLWLALTDKMQTEDGSALLSTR